MDDLRRRQAMRMRALRQERSEDGRARLPPRQSREVASTPHQRIRRERMQTESIDQTSHDSAVQANAVGHASRTSFIRDLIHSYGPHLPLIFFITGFIWDTITLNRIDQWLDQLVLSVHLLIVTISIIAIQLATRARTRAAESDVQEALARSLVGRHAHWYPNILQFSLGALFSGFFIFFSKSGTLVESWPFLLMLAGMLIGNELFKKRYERFVFQIGIYYLVIFLFLALFVPVVVGSLGAMIFVISGLASLVFISAFLFLMKLIAPIRIRKTRTILLGVICGIFVLMNVLYFTNIIPPIPLSSKEIGVYHSVSKLEEGNYEVIFEKPAWYEFWRSSDRVIHIGPGQSVYAFSAVFAPTKIETIILHSWEYYDEKEGKWKSVGKVSFPISGGRDGGYRGYSLKNNVFSGRWRIDVETQRGQLLGRRTFEIEQVDVVPELTAEVR